MIVPSVKSARIVRGSYQADKSRPAFIKPISETKVKGLERELENLEIETEQLKINLELEADIRVKAAYEEGLEAGRKLGREDSIQMVDESTDLLQNMLTQIDTALDQVWQEAKEGIVRLSMRIARRVVDKVADEYEPLAVEMADKCLKMVREQSRVTIAVNPLDVEALRAAEVDLKLVAEGVKRLEIVERQSIGRGGVVVETDAGLLDARLEEQLSMIESTILPGWSQPEAVDKTERKESK